MAAATAEAPPKALKIAPETALEKGPDLLPWFSFAGDGHLTWFDNASPDDSTTRVQPEVGRLLVAEALMWSLEQTPLARFPCGRTEMMTLLLWFAPWRTEENGRWLARLRAQVREQTDSCSGVLPF